MTGRIALAVLGVMLVAGAGSAHAEQIENPIAVFAGLDKISARITTFEVAIGETKRFGSLTVTPHVCYTRPPTEEPKTTAFVVIENIENGGTREQIFGGWMFAESPGLHALEHPVYDVWLNGCRDPSRPPEATEPETPAPDADDGDIPLDEG